MSPKSKPKAYQYEPETIRTAAWARGWMTGLEVLRVVAWKSAAGLAEVTMNRECEFNRRTHDAMAYIASLRTDPVRAQLDDVYWTRWGAVAAWAVGSQGGSGLLALRGVGYPVASAILCILDPAVWPVIDKWAVETVFGHTATQAKNAWHHWFVYRDFARHLADQGSATWPRTPTIHRLDQEAMNASMPTGSGGPPRFKQIPLLRTSPGTPPEPARTARLPAPPPCT